MIKVYIAGPMTGLPEHNYPAFHQAETELREAGFEVFNPARFEDKTLPWEHYLKQDIVELVDCHVLYLLPGWSMSRGANLEVLIARELGIPLFLAEEGICQRRTAV